MQKSGFKSYRQLVGPIETQGSCTAVTTKSQELTYVIHQMCAEIPQRYIHRHNLSMNTRHLTVDATSG